MRVRWVVQSTNGLFRRSNRICMICYEIRASNELLTHTWTFGIRIAMLLVVCHCTSCLVNERAFQSYTLELAQFHDSTSILFSKFVSRRTKATTVPDSKNAGSTIDGTVVCQEQEGQKQGMSLILTSSPLEFS
jgi:hypothetical protein